MQRFVIEATVHVEVDAKDAETAYEEFCDAIESIDGLVDFTVPKVNQFEKPYEVPAGAEVWGEAAKAIRFEDDFRSARSDGRRLWGRFDGSWWWTNGHVMLRCAGPGPTDAETWRQVEDEKILNAIRVTAARRPAILGDALKLRYGSVVRRTVGETPIAMSDAYYRLAIAVVRSWEAPLVDTDPFHGLDESGRLVAVVMPMRVKPEDLVETA